MQPSPHASHPFTQDGTYSCPICRLGQISTLPLMDAFACNFCQHLFTANLEKQILKMADRHPPLTWRWNGKQWIGGHLEGIEFGWGYLLIGVALVILPPTLLGLSAYYFPPVPGTRLAWFPAAWTSLAFFTHLGIVLWLVTEFYQFPIALYLRALKRQLIRR